jgi:hypothetical protein
MDKTISLGGLPKKGMALLDSHAAPASSWSDTPERRGEVRNGLQDVLLKAGGNRERVPTAILREAGGIATSKSRVQTVGTNSDLVASQYCNPIFLTLRRNTI